MALFFLSLSTFFIERSDRDWQSAALNLAVSRRLADLTGLLFRGLEDLSLQLLPLMSRMRCGCKDEGQIPSRRRNDAQRQRSSSD